MDGRGRSAEPRAGALPAVGLGFVAGALEAVGHAVGLALPLSGGEAAALGVVTVMAHGLVGGAVGWLAGSALAAVGARPPDVAAGRLAVTGAALAAWSLLPAAGTLWAEGRAAGAVMLAVVPLAVAVSCHQAARFAQHRWPTGAPGSAWPAVAAGSLAVALVASAAHPLRGAGAGEPGGVAVVLVTVDGLRHQDLGQLATVRALAASGTRFEDAVTPATDPTAGAASVLTGVHPLRHGVWGRGDALLRTHRTVGEVFARAGVPTAAFVSRDAVSASAGFAQGFAVFDDHLAGGPRALARVSWVERATRAWRAVTAAPESRRAADRTVAAFLAWYASAGDRSHLAWVQLVAEEGELPAVDSAIGRIVAAVDAAGRRDRTLVVVAGTAGRPEGRRFLTEPEVHVALVLRAGDRPVGASVVPIQVRTLDLAATAIAFAGIEGDDETEGMSLLPHAAGDRGVPLACALLGRDDAGAPLLGLRSDGVKWVLGPDDRDHVFDLRADPGEARDVAAEQPAVVTQARGVLAGDLVAFRARAGAP